MLRHSFRRLQTKLLRLLLLSRKMRSLQKAAEVAAQAAKDAADGTKIPETFKDYLQKYVYGCKDQDDLFNVLGGARLMNLKNEPHLGYSTRH